MERIIYTTYATAMRHRPEDLAVSGGLQPLGPRRPRAGRARIGLSRARCWLGIVAARVRARPHATAGRLDGAEAMAPAIVSGNQ
jgi:hypothetical protein